MNQELLHATTLFEIQSNNQEENTQKKKTSLLDESNTLVHTAEVLRQVEGSGLKNGWVGRGTWFGSVSYYI